jgi:hypothetical protein
MAELILTDEERAQLVRPAGEVVSGAGATVADRAACDDGLDNERVATQLGCVAATVISAEQVEDVVIATLESTPQNATHWSRFEGFKLSNDPLFIEKVYDIVGLYLNPPEAAVVLSVDAKSQVQALARSQPAFPMMPGMPEKRAHDYFRHGTTCLFAAFQHRRRNRDLQLAPAPPRERVQRSSWPRSTTRSPTTSRGASGLRQLRQALIYAELTAVIGATARASSSGPPGATAIGHGH